MMPARFELLAWPEVAAAAERGAGLLLPVGAIEQHGLHLPVDTDAYLADAISVAAVEGLDVLVAPMIPYGYRSRPLSGGGPYFPGTTSLSGTTFISVLSEMLGAFIAQGFRRLIVYSWHMENQNFVYEATYLAVGERTDVKAIVMESPFADLSPHVMDVLFGQDFPGWPAEHASILETSLMLHLRPGTVDMTKAVDDRVEFDPPYDILPPPQRIMTRSGVMARATRGSAEKGRLAFGEITTLLRRTIVAEFPELERTT